MGLRGLAHNYSVYQQLGRNGKPKYVGMTKDFTRRKGEWKRAGRDVGEIPGLDSLTRKEARAVEHLLIEQYGRKAIDKPGILENLNRGIDPRKLGKYKAELEKAKQLIAELGL